MVDNDYTSFYQLNDWDDGAVYPDNGGLRFTFDQAYHIGAIALAPVSYTHLDVYKRQPCICAWRAMTKSINCFSVNSPCSLSKAVCRRFCRINKLANSPFSCFARPKPYSCLLYTSRCV